MKYVSTQSVRCTGRASSHQPLADKGHGAAEMLTPALHHFLCNPMGGATWQNHCILIFGSLKEKERIFIYHWKL